MPASPELERPEYALFAAWAGSQLMIAISVAFTGGAAAPMLSWLAIPMLTLGARFSERGIAAGLGFSLVMLLGVTFSGDADAVFQNPPLLFAPLALMTCVAIFQAVLMRSDVKYRAAAVIDPLTGMLNRQALAQRASELEQQRGSDRAARWGDRRRHRPLQAASTTPRARGRGRGAQGCRVQAAQAAPRLRPLLSDRRRGVPRSRAGRRLGRVVRLAETLRAAIAAEPHGGQARSR